MSKLVDLTGKRFGAWTVLNREENHNGSVMWKCRCDCGTVKNIRSYTLTSGSTHGCMKCVWERNKHPNTKHNGDPLMAWRGKTNSIAYRRWSAMKDRCNNPKNKSYKNYGERGIKVCEEWCNDFHAYHDYISQLKHYGEPGYTLDRIDNNGNYEPGNVKFSTKSEQERNKRSGLHRKPRK